MFYYWFFRDREATRHRKRNRLGLDKGATMSLAECCPSRKQIVEPLGGISKTGKMLELYRDSNSTQRFHQTSCKSHFRNKPCRFLNHRVRRRSGCMQQYSYTYALVRDLDEPQTKQSWRMDYIRIKSGCSCVIKKDSSSVTWSRPLGLCLINSKLKLILIKICFCVYSFIYI